MDQGQENLSSNDTGKSIKRNYLLFLYLQALGLVVLSGCFRVVNFYFALVVTLIFLFYFLIWFYFYFKADFVDAINVSDDDITLYKNGRAIKLPVADTKIYQWLQVWGIGGSYIKSGGKWYFIGAKIYNIFNEKLHKMPGYRDYHNWIPIILFIIAAIIFLIFLLTYIY
ncbi:MAG: hypothetical protein HW405_489 [Candidatus Berkelbacteria bacterium]|nr:hypothetical protein [Candidatus Berkelbacteria bacterium]